MDKEQALKLLKDAGITQLDMASSLKMSPGTVGRYFNSKPIHRSTKAEIDRYLEELRLQQGSSEGSGPEAA